MSKFFVSIFLIHLLPVFLWADVKEVQVILDNGDRLTGQVISENEQELRLRVDYLGEISLKKSRISEVEGREVLAENSEPAKGVEKEASTKAQQLAANEKKPAGGGAMKQKPEPARPLADAPKKNAPQKNVIARKKESVQVAKSESDAGSSKKKGGLLGLLANWEEEFNPMPKWKKNLQFGYNSTSGRKDLSTLNYRLDMSRKMEKHRLNFNADYAYGEANGSTNLDKFSTKFRWRKDISPGVFYETQSVYSADAIKQIDSNVEQKIGLGTRFLDSKTVTFSAGLGASGRWREVASQGTKGDSLVNLFQDWDYKLTEKVRLKQDFKFAMPLDETDDYEVDFATSLRSEVTKSINLSVRFQLGFDNSLPKDRREDRRLISSLGYSF